MKKIFSIILLSLFVFQISCSNNASVKTTSDIQQIDYKKKIEDYFYSYISAATPKEDYRPSHKFSKKDKGIKEIVKPGLRSESMATAFKKDNENIRFEVAYDNSSNMVTKNYYLIEKNITYVIESITYVDTPTIYSIREVFHYDTFYYLLINGEKYRWDNINKNLGEKITDKEDVKSEIDILYELEKLFK